MRVVCSSRRLVRSPVRSAVWVVLVALLHGALGCSGTPATPDAHMSPDAAVVAPDAPDAPMCLPTGATCVLAEDCCSMACLVGDPMTCI